METVLHFFVLCASTGMSDRRCQYLSCCSALGARSIYRFIYPASFPEPMLCLSPTDGDQMQIRQVDRLSSTIYTLDILTSHDHQGNDRILRSTQSLTFGITP
jgi:hypothetical protein